MRCSSRTDNASVLISHFIIHTAYQLKGLIPSISEHAQYLSSLDYLESATLEFERLGIQFQEVYGRSIYRLPTLIKDVIKINTRDKMHK